MSEKEKEEKEIETISKNSSLDRSEKNIHSKKKEENEGNKIPRTNSFQWPFLNKKQDSFKSSNNIIQASAGKVADMLEELQKKSGPRPKALQLGIEIENIQLEQIQMLTDMHRCIIRLKDSMNENTENNNKRFDLIETKISSTGTSAQMKETNYILSSKLDKLEKVFCSQQRMHDDDSDFLRHEDDTSFRLKELEKLVLSIHSSNRESRNSNEFIVNKLQNLDRAHRETKSSNEFISKKLEILEQKIQGLSECKAKQNLKLDDSSLVSTTISTGVSDSEEKSKEFNRSSFEKLVAEFESKGLLPSKAEKSIDLKPIMEKMSSLEEKLNKVMSYLATLTKEANELSYEKLSKRLDIIERVFLKKDNKKEETMINNKLAPVEEKLSLITNELTEQHQATMASIKQSLQSFHLAPSKPEVELTRRKNFVQVSASSQQDNPREEKTENVKEIILGVLQSRQQFYSSLFMDRNVAEDYVALFNSAKYIAGAIIHAQGEKLSHFFVIEKGSVDIYSNGVYNCTIESRSSFGEESMIMQCESSKTFLAKEECILWLANAAELRAFSSEYNHKFLKSNVKVLEKIKLGTVTLGSILTDADLYSLASALRLRSFGLGHEIAKEGSKGDALFIIDQGEVGVYNKSFGIKPLTTIVSGGFFGEDFLLGKQSPVTCIAQTNVICFELLQEHCSTLLGDLSSRIQKAQKHFDESEDEELASDMKKIEAQSTIELQNLKTYHQLGVGRFATVKLVKFHNKSNEDETVPQKSYALKCISKNKLLDYDMLQYVSDEKEILRQIHHPFILQLHCGFEDVNYLYYLFDLHSGEDIYAVLQHNGPFSEEWSRFYVASLIDACRCIHGMKIAHRDIKPENLKLDSTGFLKLANFSIAKRIEAGKTFTLAGTLEYLAPEVILNIGYDWAVDFWAIGVFIYEMIAGIRETPFAAKYDMEVCQNILSGSILLPSTISEELKALIIGFCQTDHWKRLGRDKNGYSAIMKHLWFSGIDWDKLQKEEILPPYFPGKKIDTSTSFEKSTLPKDSTVRSFIL